MALIFLDSSVCSICGQTLKTNDAVIGWEAFLPSDHILWPFSDSGMHQFCFDEWEHKEEFEALEKFQPLIDFEDPKIIELIKSKGMPDWLKEIKEYRER